MLIEKCTVQEVCACFGGGEKLLRELRDKLGDWLKLQPHLPQDISEEKLEWIVVNTKFSLEKAKQKLDMYYTMRSLVPEFFRDRDPRGPSLTSALKAWQYVVLPKLTPDKYRLSIFRIINDDPSLYNPWEVSKYLFMAADIQMNEVDLSYGNCLVFDISRMSLNHLVKLTPALLKKCEITLSKAYASHVKGFHLINAPPFLDRLLAMIKATVNPKIAGRVYAHPVGNMESLYRFIPKSALPKDYGGEQPTMDELSVMWSAKMDNWRDWFMKSENIHVNERLRPGPAFDKDNLFGFSGSFRKLDVD